MSTPALLGLDLALAVAMTALWLGAGAVAVGTLTRRSASIGLTLAGAAAVATLARVAVVVALAGRGWWFVQEKVLLSLPLVGLAGTVALVTAVPYLTRRSGRRALPPAALLTAGYAAVAGLVVAFAVGYPARLSLFVLPVLVFSSGVLTWLVLAGGRPRGTAGLAAGCGLILVVPVALTWWTESPPDPIRPVAHHGGRSVESFRTVASPTDRVRKFSLSARQQQITLASGRTVDAWTFGSLPGPQLTVAQGDLIEVELSNVDVSAGVTLHWHGYHVPNGEDGVAGVTQDAVGPGGTFTYRVRADQPGTYWYHTHQHSAEAIRRGLYGTLVVLPPAGGAGLDIAVPVHTIDGASLLGGTDRPERREVAPGTRVRLRLVNTDQEPRRLAVRGSGYRLVSVDGHDLDGPSEVSGASLRLPAGGRYDVAFTMPSGPVRLDLEGAPEVGLTLAPPGDASHVAGAADFGPDLDLLDYGSSGAAPPSTFDREYTMVLDRTLTFLDGRPDFGYTINGKVFPHVEPITVHDGELVRLTVVNRGWQTHPMHPHGHHVRVLSRDGVAATGSPLWLDTFDVQPGEVWEVALRADNPGVWTSHCHNLDHAVDGMMQTIAYDGVDSPFGIGHATGNHPE